MPPQVVFTFLIESALVILTMVLLARPWPVFARVKGESRVSRRLTTGLGFFFLCVTFCWSVWFGCVLALHQITFKI